MGELSTSRGALPGGAMPEWKLYERRVQIANGKMQEVGVRDPKGKYHHFHQGEELVQIHTGGNDWATMVRYPSGDHVSFSAWEKVNSEKMKLLFEHADPQIVRIYMEALSEFPELEQIELKGGTKESHPALEHTGGFFSAPDVSRPEPSITVAVQKLDHVDKLLKTRELSAREAARMIGIPFQVIEKNPKILSYFIFLHELGHGYDYVTNAQGIHSSKAAEEYRAKSKSQMDTLPLRGYNPAYAKQFYDSGGLTKYFNENSAYFKGKGIHSPEALLNENERAYRNLPKESYADQFAANFMRKNWKKLQFGSTAK